MRIFVKKRSNSQKKKSCSTKGTYSLPKKNTHNSLREDKLEREVQELKVENNSLLKENDKHHAQLKTFTTSQEKLSLEMKQRCLMSDKENFQIRNLEDNMNSLSCEKQELELLLNKLIDATPSLDMQRVMREMLNTHHKINDTDREKNRINIGLMGAEGMLRTHVRNTNPQNKNPAEGIQLRKEVERLREQLSNAELQIGI